MTLGDADEFHRPTRSYPLDEIVQDTEYEFYPSGQVKDEENEQIDHPPHSNQVPNIECIEVVQHFNFNRGNAIKYIWRADAKGNPKEDLEKARWYIERELDRLDE